MLDLDRYLADQLSERAARIALSPGDVDAVIARGGRRRRRQRTVSSLVVITGLLVGVAGMERARRPDRHTAIAAGVSALRRGDTGIRWQRSETTAGLGFARALAAGGALYALSTAPGQADLASDQPGPAVVYRSTDGVNWSPVAADNRQLYLSDLSARGDRLYAVATGPATARTSGGRPVSDLLAIWSDDGASSWHPVRLPVDMGAIAARSTRTWVGPSKVAAGARGVLVVTTVGAELDLPSLLPPGVTAPNGWAVTDTGVDLLGDGPDCPAGTSAQPPGSEAKAVPATVPTGQRDVTFCFPKGKSAPQAVAPQSTRGVLRSFTWDELGVDGDLLAAVRGTAMAFLSSDGTSFERVDPPLSRVGTVEVAGDDDGFTLAAMLTTATKTGGQPAVLRSEDGHRWSPAPAPPGMVSVLGRLGDHIAAVRGDVAPSLSVLLSGAWSSAPLRDALDPALVRTSSVSLMAAGIGPLGAAVVVAVMDDPVAKAGGIEVTDHGYTLHVLNQEWGAVVTDKDGTEVARVDSLMTSPDGGPLRASPRGGTATLVDPSTGVELARFDFESAFERLGPAKEATATNAYVLFSRDGVTWSSERLADLAGRPVSMVSNVTVTDSQVLISVPRASRDSRAPGPVTVLRGTL